MPTTAAWLRKNNDGRFHRKQSEFRDQLSPDGPFAPAAGRYHLIASHACPWAHRVVLHRALLGLHAWCDVDVVSWRMQDDGSWVYDAELPGSTADHIMGARSLQQIYHSASPEFDGIGTVPVLWDRTHETIVNNESRELIRMMNEVVAPSQGVSPQDTLLPPGLTADVDAMIDANYEPINNGVYKVGFARTQEAYDEASREMFDRLDALEAHMEGRDWLVGETAVGPWGQPDGGVGTLTEADICLWVTLVRFDAVYHGHFKCSRTMIKDMPNLWAFTRRLYNLPGVRDTVQWDHIIGHYHWSHTSLNPRRIIPIKPDMDAMLRG